MKKLFILSLAAFALYSCGNTGKTVEEKVTTVIEEVADIHNAQNSLDYKGTYKGTLPAADAQGMETTITLMDSTFTKDVVYIGKKGKFSEKGKYSWNKDGNIIILEGIDAPNKYFVAENQLVALDMDGKKITGDLADKYILKKQ